MAQFQLITTEGEALGAIELARPAWSSGAVIYRGSAPSLRIIGHIATDAPTKLPVLLVEPTGGR